LVFLYVIGPILYYGGGWFAALSAATGIFTGGNYLEKKEYLKNGVANSDTK